MLTPLPCLLNACSEINEPRHAIDHSILISDNPREQSLFRKAIYSIQGLMWTVINVTVIKHCGIQRFQSEFLN